MYEDRKVLVTGGTGMIGSYIIELLLERGAEVRTVVHERPLPLDLQDFKIEVVNGDLTKWDNCVRAVDGVHYVFHLASFTGGLGRTANHPASILTPNLLMDGQIFEACRRKDIERMLYGSCACMYPDGLDLLPEAAGWAGPPPEAHANYSWAKRMGELQAEAYYREFGLKVAIVRPANSYGPRDSFDLNTSHVIPAFIRKAVERHDPFVIWGSGQTVREFIYAKDVAEGMLIALERYPVPDPINLATGRGIKIKDLASLILRLVGHTPRIVFDITKPIGQMRRVLDTEKAKSKIGFEAKFSLEEGLRETIEWFVARIKLDKG